MKRPEDIAAIRSALDEEMAASKAGDAAAFAACYTDDAVLMPPNEPAVVGKQAIQSCAQAIFDQFTEEGTAQTVEVEVTGDWGFTRLNFTMTLTPKAGGEAIEDNGKWLQIWRRQPDGSWKIYREIYNSDKPVPGTEE